MGRQRWEDNDGKTTMGRQRVTMGRQRGNDEQDGTTTNGQRSCPMPTPRYHHPQAHSHPSKSRNWLKAKHSECNEGPNASDCRLRPRHVSFRSFLFFLPTN